MITIMIIIVTVSNIIDINCLNILFSLVLLMSYAISSKNYHIKVTDRLFSDYRDITDVITSYEGTYFEMHEFITKWFEIALSIEGEFHVAEINTG